MPTHSYWNEYQRLQSPSLTASKELLAPSNSAGLPLSSNAAWCMLSVWYATIPPHVHVLMLGAPSTNWHPNSHALPLSTKPANGGAQLNGFAPVYRTWLQEKTLVKDPKQSIERIRWPMQTCARPTTAWRSDLLLVYLTPPEGVVDTHEYKPPPIVSKAESTPS